MRYINLHFKDSTITKIDNGKFQFTFDLINMISERFSKNTRMYINSLNLCEFHDDEIDKNLTGSFRLCCNFVNNQEILSSSGNSLGHSIIYDGNLNSYHTFQNQSPLYSYNYSINENAFNSGKLQFIIEFYNEIGDIFISYPSQQQIMNSTTTEYATYITANNSYVDGENELHDLKNDINNTAFLINHHESLQNTLDINFPIRMHKFIKEITNRVTSQNLKENIRAQSPPILHSTVMAIHQNIINLLLTPSNLDNILDFFNGFDISDTPYFANSRTHLHKIIFPNFRQQFLTPNLQNQVVTQRGEIRVENLTNFASSENFYLIDHVFDLAHLVDSAGLVPIGFGAVKNDSSFKTYEYVATYSTKKDGSVPSSGPHFIAGGTVTMKFKNLIDNVSQQANKDASIYLPIIKEFIPQDPDATKDDNLLLASGLITFTIENHGVPASGAGPGALGGVDFLEPLSQLPNIPGGSASDVVSTETLILKIDSKYLSRVSQNKLTKNLISLKTDSDTKSSLVPSIKIKKEVLFTDVVEPKLPSISMSLVLYDEDPLETEVSQTEVKEPVRSLTKNNIQRNRLPSFRRY